MSSRTSYFPSRDAEIVTWANAFASVLVAQPVLYGATPAIAASFQADAANLHNAYLTSQDPATRTRGAIASKEQAKEAMKVACRKIVRVIYAQDLTEQQLIDIGLRRHAVVRTRSPIPGAAPILKVVSVYGHQVRIKLKDASGESRGRPRFVSSAQIYSFIGANPPSGREGWRLEACATRTSLIIPFAQTIAPGSKVFLTAAWMNTRGATGPACTPVVTSIGYEGAMPMAG